MRIFGLVIVTVLALFGCGEPTGDTTKREPSPPAPPKLWETRPPIPPLKPFETHGRIDHDGASIWYASIVDGEQAHKQSGPMFRSAQKKGLPDGQPLNATIAA